MRTSSTPSLPLRTAVAGIGGFAGAHHSALQTLEQKGTVKVEATCDPSAAKLSKIREERQLSERGIEVYEDFEPMMATWGDRLDLLTVAAPIPVHAAMHRACVERGIACYMEKPPTLNPEELEEMIARDEAAKVPTEVGFNFIYQPFRHELKARILSGEFGKLKRISFQGLWPRSLTYYGRNGWAGRLLTDSGTITLDSCCGNAMAHHVHNVLFFAGTEGINSWGVPRELEAELYRANEIQGTDTIFCRAKLENDVELRIAASHACANEHHISLEIIECEDATIRISPTLSSWELIRKDGSRETHEVPQATLYENMERYSRVITGEVERPSTLLSDCRGFVRLNALFYLAARQITTVTGADNESITQTPSGQVEQTYRTIRGIAEITNRALSTGEFPSEQGVAWAKAGGTACTADLPRLREALAALIAQG